jgi:hypothetical protein
MNGVEPGISVLRDFLEFEIRGILVPDNIFFLLKCFFLAAARRLDLSRRQVVRHSLAPCVLNCAPLRVIRPFLFLIFFLLKPLVAVCSRPVAVVRFSTNFRLPGTNGCCREFPFSAIQLRGEHHAL